MNQGPKKKLDWGGKRVKEKEKPDEESPRCRSKIGFFSTEIYAGRSSNGIDVGT